MVDFLLTVVIVLATLGATFGLIQYVQRKATGNRPADLKTVQRWFQPALQPGEILQAAIGVSAGRKVLLLTDRSIHIVARKFWIRRFRKAYSTFQRGTVTIRYGPPGQQTGRSALEIGETAIGAIGASIATEATRSFGNLWIADDRYALDALSSRMAGSVGSAEDIRLLIRAGSPAEAK